MLLFSFVSSFFFPGETLKHLLPSHITFDISHQFTSFSISTLISGGAEPQLQLLPSHAASDVQETENSSRVSLRLSVCLLQIVKFIEVFTRGFILIAHGSLSSDLFNPDSFRLVALRFMCPQRLFICCVMKSTHNPAVCKYCRANVSFEKNHQSETITFLQRVIFGAEAEKTTASLFLYLLILFSPVSQ